jgi:LysM repeat protein
MPAYDDDGNLMPGFHINPEDGSPYYDPSKPNDVGGADTTGSDPSQMPAYDDDGNLMPGFHINPETGEAYYDPSKPDEVAGLTTDAGPAPGGDTFGGGTYTIQKGDQLGYIAQANGVSVEDIRGINPQIDFSKPLQPGTEIQLPVAGTPGQGNVWQSYQGGMYGDKTPVSESWLPVVNLRLLSADKLIDQKSTVMSWALSESVGVKGKSMHLTTAGTYTVFENVDRYRKAIMEKAGVPGSTRPAFYRPDMPGGPGKQSKPGLIGRGLNALDRGVKKVGGALGNFGHQFTTGVTKEKLKMNWHQAGKPSDSDQLAAWLTKQGVPQEVVTSVYGKMGIPYAPQAAPAKAQAAEPQAATAGGAQRSMPFYGTNPATKKPWTYDELQTKSQASTAPAPAATTSTTAAKTATTAQPGFNATNVMQMPGMEKYAKAPAPAKPASFASGPTGYGKTTMSVKPMTGIPGMKAPTAPAAPSAPKAPGVKYNLNLPAGGGAGVKAAAQPGQLSKDEYIRRIGAPAMPESRVFNALKKPVAEMLNMVETKEDVAKIKQFIDQTFVKYGAVTESAFAVRNRLIEHVTQVGAQRRREFARKG